MFIDEVKSKFKLDDVTCAYSVCLFGRNAVSIEGVKTVILTSPNTVKLRVNNCVILIEGEELCLTEIGGGSVYVRGNVGAIVFE